jgi:hypothetical protein
MATQLTVFPDEEQVDLGDVKLTLSLSFRTITVCEQTVRKDEIVPMPYIAGWVLLEEMPPVSLVATVLWALLREHHEDMTHDAVMGLMFTSKHANRLGIGLRALLGRHFDFTPPKEKVKNPPKRRGASKTSSANG